jgi:hypothetical protein
MANESPPWADIRALMAGRLLAIDKFPGIRPIEIGETWWRAISKCILHVAGKDNKEACGIDQLCAGLESGIEGAIQAIQHMWSFTRLKTCSLMHLMRSMNRTGAACYGRFGTSGQAEQSLPSTAIKAGPPSGSEATTALASFFEVKKASPMETRFLCLLVLKKMYPKMNQAWYADDAGVGGNFDHQRASLSCPSTALKPRRLHSLTSISR